jgi:hypothetical protein
MDVQGQMFELHTFDISIDVICTKSKLIFFILLFYEIMCNLFVLLKRPFCNYIFMAPKVDENIVVTYTEFDSNIRVFYVFLGFLKNTWKYLIQRPIFKPLYHYNVFLKYLKILLFGHLWKIFVFRMSLLWMKIYVMIFYWCKT